MDTMSVFKQCYGVYNEPFNTALSKTTKILLILLKSRMFISFFEQTYGKQIIFNDLLLSIDTIYVLKQFYDVYNEPSNTAFNKIKQILIILYRSKINRVFFEPMIIPFGEKIIHNDLPYMFDYFKELISNLHLENGIWPMLFYLKIIICLIVICLIFYHFIKAVWFIIRHLQRPIEPDSMA